MGIALSITLIACILGLILLERICNAFCTILVHAVIRRQGRTGDVRSYASLQLIGSMVSFQTSLLSAFGNMFGSAVSAILGYALWFFLMTCIFSILYVLQGSYPKFLPEIAQLWNQVAPVLHTLLVLPMQLVQVLFTALVPIYNLWIYLGTRLLREVTLKYLPTLLDILLDIGINLTDLCKHLVYSTEGYLSPLVNPCTPPVSDTCYAVGPRLFDFLTPMSDVSKLAYNLGRITHGICAGAAGPSDIALYPFTDLNLAKALHNILNSILFALVQLPAVTTLRCQSNNRDLLMCLPDFEPCFNLMATGLRNLGTLLDNWLNVASVIIQKSLRLVDAEELDCEQVPLTLSPANYNKRVFTGGQKSIRVVGLTENLYAVTDGLHVEYFDHHDSTSSVISTLAWPMQVDVSMGIAAVTYFDGAGGKNSGESDSLGNPSTTMLGCACFDQGGLPPMRIRCALALHGGPSYDEKNGISPDDLMFDVVFQRQSTADYMTCKTSEISVQSVRWPASRFTGQYSTEQELQQTCQSRQDCTQVDATIWVAPICTSNSGVVPLFCIPTFIKAACFPYCMAIRKTGSAATGMVLYNAPTWKEKVHLIGRDCASTQPHLAEDPWASMQSGSLYVDLNNEASDANPASVQVTHMQGNFTNIKLTN